VRSATRGGVAGAVTRPATPLRAAQNLETSPPEPRHRSLQTFTEGSLESRYDSIAQIVGRRNVNVAPTLIGSAMPDNCCRRAPGQIELCPIDMTDTDFSALEGDEDLLATAEGLVRDQLVRTGEAVAWATWEGLRGRLKNLPGMKGAILRPTRAEAEALGYMDEAGRHLERGIEGARRRALEARAVRELREERARRSTPSGPHAARGLRPVDVGRARGRMSRVAAAPTDKHDDSHRM
jgi:hypothetical protein